MTITVAQLRADYPEFSSSATYPAPVIQFWLNFAYNFLNADRWGNSIDMGAELFAAHNIVLEQKAQASAQVGGVPGEQVGPIASKSVDKVSVNYDVGSGIEPDAGHWNLTVYGTRFIRLSKMMGAGPLQVGMGAVPPLSGAGWPGPLTAPGFSNFG